MLLLRSKRIKQFMAGVGLLSLVIFPAFATAQSDATAIDKASHSAWSSVLLANAAAEGLDQVPVLIAAEKGKTAEVEGLVKQAGGSVLKSIQEIGYVKASIPTARFRWLLSQPSVVDVSVEGNSHVNDGLSIASYEIDPESAGRFSADREQQRKETDAAKKEAESRDAKRTAFPAELLSTGKGLNPNDYLQATDWLKKHPAWDGRGVTLTILEGVADLSNPMLQDRKDQSGNAVSKVKALVHPTNVDGFVLTWIGEVGFDKQTLTNGTKCPSPTNDEKVGVWTALVNRRPYPEYCVAWNAKTEAARIDLNQNGIFDDEVRLRDYNEKQEYVKVYADPKNNDGIFATAYIVYEKEKDKLYIRTTSDNHATMTATAAAGTSFMGTPIGGVAPGAQLVFAGRGAKWSGYVEAFWESASLPDVDLISASTGIASYPNDKQPIYYLFLDRISEVTGKPILLAARNHGPAFEQAQFGKRIMSVGGYVNADSLKAFTINDEQLENAEEIEPFSVGGPSMDGGFGANFVAPVLGVTGWNTGNIEERPTVMLIGKNYKLPRGYGVGGGTSVATPRAAGAIALLLSAAKQTGLKVDAMMIRQALMASARPIESEGMYRQGTGLIQVERAWEALNEIAKAPKITIRSSSTAISPLYPYWWRGPKVGESIYLTRDVFVGQARKLPLDLWIENPVKGDNKFSLSVVGDKANFKVPSSVDLSKRQQITVEFNSTRPGNYSAVIELRRQGAKYPTAQIPVMVVSSPDPEELKKGIELTGTVTAEMQEFRVFTLPKGTRIVEAKLETTGNIKPTVRYAYDDPNPRRMSFHTLNTIQGDSFELGKDATILGVNINVSANYPLPCCQGTYKLKLRVSTDQPKASQPDLPKQEVTLKAPGEVPMELTEAKVPAGDSPIQLTAACPACSKDADYEIYVFKTFKNARGQTQQGIWTYWPVFNGTFTQTVPRDKDGATWKFVVMRKGPQAGK